MLAIQQRTTDFFNTLREVNKLGAPNEYEPGKPIQNLAVLSDIVNTLCWHIDVATKQTAPAPAAHIKKEIERAATKAINICITELTHLGRSTDGAIELITTDGALWFWNIDTKPLSTLDLKTNYALRIQSLLVAAGQVAEWWPNKISPQENCDLPAEQERVFVNLAYEATCAILASRRDTIV
jgi:hypothetical protein